ncbi:MAG: outer membrane lipoprotein-sorting protein [Spirochaetia bacterium]|nr:outer membrane lipoprotein-sorting protein [Spirochaetota bacterium]MCX8096614.1 outer membrane lipoprotein-sorting protein [Spirochaetota bacterium]MDW8112061.1 outer membrane lipoprotein-sorting protein [Spirochaetia bacterium]
MNKIIWYIVFLCICGLGFSITGDEILRRVDANLNFKNAIINAKMEIYLPGQQPRVKIFRTYIIEDQKAYTEFLNKEDKNIRYLKLGKQLWIHDKSENNTILISGHLLKQGMMGSDISYEDMLESEDLYSKYTSSLEGEDKIKNRDCYIILLKAKTDNVAYHSRKMWVDKEYYISLREERFAVSGRLLKTVEVEDFKLFGTRHYPTVSVVSDKLKANTKTIISIQNIDFDTSIQDSIFTKRYLER